MDENEKILYAGHRHFIAVFKKLLKVAIFGILIPWTLYIILGTPFFFWTAFIITIIVYIKFMYLLMDWYFDVLLITSESIIFARWSSFFNKDSTRTAYKNIDSITIESAGVSSTLLNYGNMTIERDSGDPITFDCVSQPKRLELEIIRGQNLYDKQDTASNSDVLESILNQMVGSHVKKHGWKRK